MTSMKLTNILKEGFILTTFVLIIVGILVGTIVIALGGGGGAIYLGILSSSFHLSPASAAATSIITSLPALIIGVIGYAKQKRINFHVGNQMLLAALPAVVIGSLISPHIPKLIYTWIIGIILIILGLQIFFKKSKQDSINHNPYAAAAYGILGGLMVGVAGLSGGGPILAGLLLLGLDTFNATATSAYVLVGMSILGSIFHISSGNVYWQAGIPLLIGAICGAVIAPLLVNVLAKSRHPEWINYFIAVLLIYMGVKTLV